MIKEEVDNVESINDNDIDITEIITLLESILNELIILNQKLMYYKG